MSQSRQTLVMFLSLLALGYLIYLLSATLTPFLFGALLAYLANPAVKRLEKLGMPHWLSVVSLFVVILLALLLVILFLFPMIQHQVVQLVDMLPRLAAWIQKELLPWLEAHFELDWPSVSTTLTTALPKTSWLLGTVLHSGQAVVGVIITIVLIPVVMFYMLRDWDAILLNVLEVFPFSWRDVIQNLAKESDLVLSAFFRGQLLVMLCLSMIYGVGLSIVGLKVGLMIGVVGGLLSIVPYLGSLFVLTAGCLMAGMEMGDWHSVGMVIFVYVIGQLIEGYLLTPYLVGEKIGLHPVAVIFSVMAGGTLFGFFGVLIALPAAAVLKVWLRYVQKQYVLHL